MDRDVLHEEMAYEYNQNEAAPTTIVAAMMAHPVCGWSVASNSFGGACIWKDPRECCLCHLCGDDDAGFSDNEWNADVDAETTETSLGRLLPMGDGYFVHTGCALWSSETWEDPKDSLIHAVDKARGRGAQLKCFGCGRYGATVGCSKSNCLFNYHFPCAKACGGLFTSSQHMFCVNHKSSATSVLVRENFEHMKTIMVAPGKDTAAEKETDRVDRELCFRIGSLIVHSLGRIDSSCDGYHSESYISPPGYVASRIFWSTLHPKKRTVYLLKVERSISGPAFTILPGDDPLSKVIAPSVSQAYDVLLERVRKVNGESFSLGNLLSKLPAVRRTRRKTFGLNGPQVSELSLFCFINQIYQLTLSFARLYSSLAMV
jgi:hypothetical protein